MLARVKLKGIDGGPHKRWSMWFNSMQREEPYQDLTCHFVPERGRSRVDTGGAWLSSARVLRCWVKSRNERNPCFVLPIWETQKTAGDKPEEGEDDVKSACPLRPGRHTCYNGRDKEMQTREGEPTS
jgi:hypothetical protein